MSSDSVPTVSQDLLLPEVVTAIIEKDRAFFDGENQHYLISPGGDDRGHGVIHLAIEANNLGLVTKLIDHYGVDPDIRTRGSGLTPLHVAVLSQNLGIARALLSRDEVDRSVTELDSGCTFLGLAMKAGDENAVELLLPPGVVSSTIYDQLLHGVSVADSPDDAQATLNAILSNRIEAAKTARANELQRADEIARKAPTDARYGN